MDVEQGTTAEFIPLSQLEALVIEEQAKDYTIRAKKLELLNQGIDLELINAIDKEFDISTAATPDYSEFQQNFSINNYLGYYTNPNLNPNSYFTQLNNPRTTVINKVLTGPGVPTALKNLPRPTTAPGTNIIGAPNEMANDVVQEKAHIKENEPEVSVNKDSNLYQRTFNDRLSDLFACSIESAAISGVQSALRNYEFYKRSDKTGIQVIKDTLVDSLIGSWENTKWAAVMSSSALQEASFIGLLADGTMAFFLNVNL